MVKKKDPERKYAIERGKWKITYRALVTVLIAIIIIFIIVRYGFNKESGCYSNPTDIKVNIDKKISGGAE